MKEKMMNLLMGIRADIDFETCTTLVDQKILTSLDIIQVISEVEDVFGVEIPAEEITAENLNSVYTLVALVERLKR